METNKHARIFGGLVITLAMFYYTYEIYFYIDNWYSLTEIQEDTECDEMHSLEIWLFSQNIIWLISLVLLLTIMIKPGFYKLLLCFLYLMGPVYFSWTIVAIGYYASFLTCCRSAQDTCTDYYPYYSPAGFVTLILVSVIFSSLIMIYLFSLLAQVLWAYFRHRFEQYLTLLL